MFQVVAYSPDAQVTPDSALHDRIDIDLDGWAVHEATADGDDTENLQNLANFIAVPPILQRNGEECSLYGILFNRPNGRTAGVRTLKVRTTALALGANDEPPVPPALVKGKLVGMVSGSSGQRVFTFRSNLHLNATRYLRQLRPRYRLRQHLEPNDSIFVFPVLAAPNGESSLDGKDNWLPANAEGQVAGSRESAHERSVTGLIQNVWERVSYEIRHAVYSVNFATPERLRFVHPQFSVRLSQVETYWEFFHEEPLRFIELMVAAANSFVGEATLSSFRRRTSRQSLSLSIKYRSGVILRVYAKTNRRIRFEVQHDLKVMNVPFSSPGFMQELGRVRQTFADLRNDAAEIVNAFLRHINPITTQVALQRSPVALLFEIAAATRNLDHARLLMEALCVNGRYEVLENDLLRPAIRLLADRGVLRNRHRSNVYAPSPVWQYASSVLSDQGRLDVLLCAPVLAEFRQNQRASNPRE